MKSGRQITREQGRMGYLWVVVVVVLALIGGYILKGPSSSKVAATLRAADMKSAVARKDVPSIVVRLVPELFLDVAWYKERIERLQEITGDSPREIGRVTLKYSEQAHMPCSGFLSILCTQLRLDRRGDEPRWHSYEEAAEAYVAFHAANPGWIYPPRP